jgi:hypothetical protein
MAYAKCAAYVEVDPGLRAATRAAGCRVLAGPAAVCQALIEQLVDQGGTRQAAKRKHYPVSRTGAHCESSYAGPHVRSLKWVLTTKDRQL